MNFKEKQMTKRRQQAIILLALSVPMMWWGYSSFMDGTTNSNIQAIAVSLSCTLGSLFAISGLVMLATKNSLGIWNPDDKGKKDRGVVLASQANVGDSSVQKEIINKKPKVNEMAKVMAKAKTTKDTHVADSVKEFREIGQSMKDGATRRANIRARLKEMGIAIDEDGKIDV